MSLLSLLLACSPASIKLDDTGTVDSGDTAADSGDTATDSGDSGDTSADSGDTSGDTGDSGPAATLYRGELAGAAELTRDNRTERVSCTGTFRLSVTDDGRAAGEGECVSADGEAFVGPMQGGVVDGAVEGLFVYEGFGFAGEARLSATLTPSTLEGLIAEQAEGIAMSLLLDGTAEN